LVYFDQKEGSNIPTIPPNLIPTKTAGTLFSSLIGGDATLNVRWLTAVDPVHFEAANRPVADVFVRQLVIAKAVDALQLAIGNQSLFPFLIQPRVASGTTAVDIPAGWIWDIHLSLPRRWENVRLARIKRMSGEGTGGTLRLVFTANVVNSITEVSIFYADYNIESVLSYQPMRLSIVDEQEQNPIAVGESASVAGNIIFRTLDIESEQYQDFYELIEPPENDEVDSSGFYLEPSVYEITDSPAGSEFITGDYGSIPLSHGTGLLTDSAWNLIPDLNSDVQSWLDSMNYPFDADCNRTSADGIVIPKGLFKEFNVMAPEGDGPTSDTSGTSFPVWIFKARRLESGTTIRFNLATYNLTDNPSTVPIEFAYFDVNLNDSENRIVELIPDRNLLLRTGADAANWYQGFGRGHVVLSSVWGPTTQIVDEFFAQFSGLMNSDKSTLFPVSSTRISSHAVNRAPKNTPTNGQSAALSGSVGSPSTTNKYVTEKDQGIGLQIDLESRPNITVSSMIDRYGYTGSLTHRVVKLVINSSNITDPNFYNIHVLPRLRILLGRDPQFGDFWYNGTRLMFYNGDVWLG